MKHPFQQWIILKIGYDLTKLRQYSSLCTWCCCMPTTLCIVARHVLCVLCVNAMLDCMLHFMHTDAAVICREHSEQLVYDIRHSSPVCRRTCRSGPVDTALIKGRTIDWKTDWRKENRQDRCGPSGERSKQPISTDWPNNFLLRRLNVLVQGEPKQYPLD